MIVTERGVARCVPTVPLNRSSAVLLIIERMRANRTDANQREIVRALRACGASVQPLNAVKAGCPDLLVGWQGCNYLLEVKDGDKARSARQLTPDEDAWHRRWKGTVATVLNADEALRVCRITT